MTRLSIRHAMRVVIAAALMSVPSLVQAADFDQYQRLVGAAIEAQENLRDAPEADLPALRESAETSARAVIAWLDAFFEDPDFHTLPEEQRTLAIRDRARWEYALARVLIDQGDCQEARDSISALLASPSLDEELRPRVLEARDASLNCTERVRTATLVVDCTPPETALVLDGDVLGPASSAYQVELGEHTLQLRADGYMSEELSLSVAEADSDVHVGPIELVAIEAAVSPLPSWYEWTLWGLGAACITTSVVVYASARERDDMIDNPPTDYVIANPEGEQEVVDRMNTAAIVTGSIGLASVIAGTVSYFVRRGREADRPDDATSDVSVAVGPGWLILGLDF